MFHTDLWFGLAWGAFPVLVAYLGAAETLRPEAFLAAGFALLTSLAQRSLSTQVRTVRRRVTHVSGTVRYRDGQEDVLDANALTRAPEAALRALSVGMVALALALVWLQFA